MALHELCRSPDVVSRGTARALRRAGVAAAVLGQEVHEIEAAIAERDR
jgi:hypothetical protein